MAGVHAGSAGFSHEALLYAGEDEFVDRTTSFIREGAANGEPTFVLVDSTKIERLRTELDGNGAGVTFADIQEVGLNPARIIPIWRDFVDRHGDSRPLRGIGEPIWGERTPAELVECQRHESLLNLAFADAPAFRLLCPYDTDALDDAVIEEALRSHPTIVARGAGCESPAYRGVDAIGAPFDAPLSEPPPTVHELAFGSGSLSPLRAVVRRCALAAGLERGRSDELVLAVDEMATNSIRYGGGEGVLRIWEEADAVVCEVEDRGRIEEALIGRIRPRPESEDGRGHWLANQLCDLVQVRSFPTGSTVRLHMRR